MNVYIYRGWMNSCLNRTQLSWVIIHSCEWFALKKESDDIFVGED